MPKRKYHRADRKGEERTGRERKGKEEEKKLIREKKHGSNLVDPRNCLLDVSNSLPIPTKLISFSIRGGGEG